MTSVAKKAKELLDKKCIFIDSLSCKTINARVRHQNKEGKFVEYYVTIWYDDGHYSCECEWFLRSKDARIFLWNDNDREKKPECKHALAVKLTDVYKEWIRMCYIPDPDGGYILKTIEPIEEIKVKSLDDNIDKKKILKKAINITSAPVKKIEMSKIIEKTSSQPRS